MTCSLGRPPGRRRRAPQSRIPPRPIHDQIRNEVRPRSSPLALVIVRIECWDTPSPLIDPTRAHPPVQQRLRLTLPNHPPQLLVAGGDGLT